VCVCVCFFFSFFLFWLGIENLEKMADGWRRGGRGYPERAAEEEDPESSSVSIGREAGA
jgi:hypothetical protein